MTTYAIEGTDFLINGKKTYSEIPGSNENVHGLLFNARFIQGIFHDSNPANKGQYDRRGKIFDPDENTAECVASLQQWYDKGLRAITVGMQGGGPIYSYEDWSCIRMDTFSGDGKTIREDSKRRMESIIKEADRIGMLVIVSVLYQAQSHLLDNEVAIMNAVRSTCEWLASLPYSNIIIEVANEHNVGDFSKHPVVGTDKGMSCLVSLAQEWCGHRFAVGSSGGGGVLSPETVNASDVIIVHGNGLRREEMNRFMRNIRKVCSTKPIVINECSQMFDVLTECGKEHFSWGYYNTSTKQELVSRWEICPGEDEFFAERMYDLIHGIPQKKENRYYFEGVDKEDAIHGGLYPRIASLYPRRIDYVDFYEDEKLLGTSYDEPFMLNMVMTWAQKPYFPSEGAKTITAAIHNTDGTVVEISRSL